MPNPYFQFKQFTVYHDRCAMKVTTDSCVFGAWVARELAREETRTKRLLDIGSGTGLLSMMIAQKNEVEIDAVEIDNEAAVQSKENITSSPWKERIRVFNQDITLFKTDGKYDCIVCNPPFYENDLSSESKTKNTAHHSENLTLVEVVEFIAGNLNEGGTFFLMLPFKRREELKRLVEQNRLHLNTVLALRQSLKHGPFRILVRGSNSRTDTRNEIAVSIWDEDQQYTDWFVELLKDYYLYL
ncbi:MAG: tRNA1(Val) (adenine(37)-N6)-methyltransferase, partial [Flavisolibacter sp.]